MENINEELDKAFKKAGWKLAGYTVGGLATLAALLAGISIHNHRVEERLAQKDAATRAFLIEKKEAVTDHGFAGMLFFSTTDQTNRMDSIMHYVTRDPGKIQEIKGIQPGTVRKVSEWKGLFPNGYRQKYAWYELSKE